MLTTFTNRLRLVVPICIAALSICFASLIPTTSLAQDQDAKKSKQKDDAKKSKPKKNRRQKRQKDQKPDPTDKRLDAIEQALKNLAAEIKSMRQSDNTKPATGTGTSTAQSSQTQPINLKLPSEWLSNVRWRSIGPANMGGRITDVVVHDKDPSLWWMATASGGLLKTTNRGTTVTHQFDKEATVSIGAIASDPNDVKTLWVGTGEANPRNSVSYGDGAYKSTDGGQTWKHMGLKKSFQISRILVDPSDSKTVYVGVAGRLYGTNSERGVYKTTDGGESWEKVLYIDDQTGVIDMIMNPEDPKTLIVAMWDRLRDGFDSWPGTVAKPEGIDGYDPIRKWGKGGGLYKTTDAGSTWKKLKKGLPTSKTGRIGIDWQSKSPHTIYAIIDCEDIGKGPKPFRAYLGLVGIDKKGKATVAQIIPESPAERAKIKPGDVIVSVDEKALTKADELLDVLREKKVYDKIKLTLARGDETLTEEIVLTGRPGTQQSNPPTVWLGAAGADAEGKIVLNAITPNSPAAKAKLKQGDVVIQLDGKDIDKYQSLIEQVRKKTAGKTVTLKVQRDKESLDIELTLELRPTRQVPQQSSAYMGIRGEDSPKGGAVLTVITSGGPSEKAGLKAGDIVKKIAGKKTASYQELIQELRARQPDDKLKLSILRGEKTLDLTVTLGDRRRGGSSSTRPYTYSYFGQTPNAQDQQGAKGHLYGGVYRSRDAGESWERVNSLNTRPMYFSVIRVDPSNEENIYVLGVSQFQSKNGGITFTGDFGRGVHADGHDLWIDPNDGRHMLIGCDGGFYISYDSGQNWDHVNTAAVGQFYHATISPKEPYWVIGGLQDNGSWGGPAISKQGGAVNEDWISVGGGDGFVCRVDPTDPNLVYTESQNGSISRRHLKTGERASIRPRRVEGVSYRFNWNTPFVLSHHNSKIFYSAGNYVFRSLDRGNDLKAISPEITLTQRGSATALSESPMNPDVLYAGTDDGALWATRDGGQEWTNITKNLGIPDPRWVSTIEASRFVQGRVYVCLDAHRSDDDNPYIFVSEDFGATFKPLHKQLPWGSTRCLREDIKNPNLLYLGTEFALWVSLDRGGNWTQFNQNLPTVAIHEVAIHPSNGEIVVATHGRSLWACDVTGLRQLKPEHINTTIALHDPQETVRWRSEPRRGRTNRRYVGTNPSTGAQLWYSLPKKAQSVRVRIENIAGQVISELSGNTDQGLHAVNWRLTQTTQPRSRNNQTAPQAPQRTGRTRRPTSSADTSKKSADTEATSSEESKQKEKKQEQAKATDTQKEAKKDVKKAKKKRDKKDSEGQTDKTTEKKAEAQAEAKAKESEDANKKAAATQQPPRPPARQGRATAPPTRATTGRFQGRGGRPVPNGSYRVSLVVDGKEIASKVVSVERDPSIVSNAIADELYEAALLRDEEAAAAKKKAKAEGRSSNQDY